MNVANGATLFSKRLGEQSAVSSPLSLCVSHFGKLLEDGPKRLVILILM